jgi:hypothetical protein
MMSTHVLRRMPLAGLALAATIGAAACGVPAASPTPAPPSPTPSPTQPATGPIERTWTFDKALQDFSVDISDFDPETRGELRSGLEPLPAPLTGAGLRVFANNFSDDLWHFLWREVGAAEGVTPNTTYAVTIKLRVASNIASGCMGVGGSPDSIFLKGGVVAVQPAAVSQPDGSIGFSADKGNQAQVGPEAVDLGTIGTDGEDCTGDTNPWQILERSGTMTATSTADGRLWVYVGGDSGFESATTLYYLSVGVTLAPQA